MSMQTEINERMRAILIDWIIEVQNRLMLMPESLYLTVYIIDQYLSNENVPKKELQLVGVSAMLIASKYEEMWAPLVGSLLLMLLLSMCCLPNVLHFNRFILRMNNNVTGQGFVVHLRQCFQQRAGSEHREGHTEPVAVELDSSNNVHVPCSVSESCNG
jgi:hypothetical protein